MPFAKHESFYIREGWLFKGLRAVSSDPTIFVASDAPERLGLGKNMVRALRFWMQAANLTTEVSVNRVREQRLTELGKRILVKDPYLELDGTLWFIHHELVCSRELATTWYWFFNHFTPVSFTRKEFTQRLTQWINTQTQSESEDAIAEGTVRKDFDCLMHTYLTEHSEDEKSPEDQIESPLTTLGVLSGYRERDDESEKVVHRYRFQPGLVENIPPLVFLYVLLSRQEHERPGRTQVSLSAVLREPMNVGRTFNIGMRAFEDLAARLEDIDSTYSIHLDHAGDMDELTLPDHASYDILEQYYSQQLSMESGM